MLVFNNYSLYILLDRDQVSVSKYSQVIFPFFKESRDSTAYFFEYESINIVYWPVHFCLWYDVLSLLPCLYLWAVGDGSTQAR